VENEPRTTCYKQTIQSAIIMKDLPFRSKNTLCIQDHMYPNTRINRAFDSTGTGDRQLCVLSSCSAICNEYTA